MCFIVFTPLFLNLIKKTPTAYFPRSLQAGVAYYMTFRGAHQAKFRTPKKGIAKAGISYNSIQLDILNPHVGIIRRIAIVIRPLKRERMSALWEDAQINEVGGHKSF